MNRTNIQKLVGDITENNLNETIYSDYSRKPPEQYFWEQFLVGHEIMIYLKKFMSEYENKLPGCQNVLGALATAITHQIIRSLLKITNKVDFITDKFEIEQTVEFMYQHFGEKLTITDLAQIANMSESQYFRIFKKETGLSPMEFLIRVRIDKAKKLLRSGTKNISKFI